MKRSTAVLAAILTCASALATRAADEPGDRSKARVALGELLYFDRRLSRDSSTSCATCHNPKLGWTDHRPTVLGIHEQLGERNAPTVLNAARQRVLFWDGRATTLEEQSKEPIANPREMGFTLREAEQRIGGVKGYAGYFREAFGDSKVTIDRISEAIAAFERTIANKNSAYDRFLAGDKKALSRPARRGALLFAGKARCAQCHTGPDLSDEKFHNLGAGMQRRVQDFGRFTITKNEADRGAFKTPGLRNVADTFPYMHDGSLATLPEVVDFLDAGGYKNQWLSPEIAPLGLSKKEKQELVAFLESLSGDKRVIEPPRQEPE